jgi:hypothetical protein
MDAAIGEGEGDDGWKMAKYFTSVYENSIIKFIENCEKGG